MLAFLKNKLSQFLVGVDADVLSGERQRQSKIIGKRKRQSLVGAGSVAMSEGRFASKAEGDALFKELRSYKF